MVKSQLRPLGFAAWLVQEYRQWPPFCLGCIILTIDSYRCIDNGKRKDGVRKFCCRDCGRSFVAKTNTVASGTRKSLDTWMKYIECMMNWATVREAAERCDISESTSFLWRHKILDAMQLLVDSITLEGIVEADEAYHRQDILQIW